MRSIGVSNFRIQDLEVINNTRIKPAVNEIEYSAYLQQRELIEYCKNNNIVPTSYGGLGPIAAFKGGPLDPVLDELSKTYSSTPAQIIQRWIITQGVGIVTTTGKPHRMKEFFEAIQLQISQEHLNLISTTGANENKRKFWTKEFAN